MSAAALLSEIQSSTGLSQAELARRAGLSRSVVNAYARGTREPGADALDRIARGAGLQLGLLPRTPVDPQRAARILEQVLDLAEALPGRRRGALAYPPLR